MILQRTRIIAGDAGFEPGTSAQKVGARPMSYHILNKIKIYILMICFCTVSNTGFLRGCEIQTFRGWSLPPYPHPHPHPSVFGTPMSDHNYYEALCNLPVPLSGM